MKLTLRIFFAALLWTAFSISGFAQTLTGKVVDENDEPLAYANVVLQKNDSTFIAGTVTDTLGVFRMPGHHDATMLQVSFVSYNTAMDG